MDRTLPAAPVLEWWAWLIVFLVLVLFFWATFRFVLWFGRSRQAAAASVWMGQGGGVVIRASDVAGSVPSVQRSQLDEKRTPAAKGGASASAPSGQRLDTSAVWLDLCAAALCLLVTAAQRVGKSTVVHEITRRRVERGQRVVVFDVDARPGMWPGCQVVGIGGDYAAIDHALQAVGALIEKRRQARGQGARRFAPVTIALIDYAGIAASCEHARPALESMLRQAGKLGIFLMLDVQDRLVDTLKIPAALQVNFDRKLALEYRGGQFDPDRGGYVGGQRVAVLDDQAYAVPDLPDPELLADRYAAALGAGDAPDRADLELELGQPGQPVDRVSGPAFTLDHVRAALMLQHDPGMSDRALARALWPELTQRSKGGGDHAVKASAIRAAVWPLVPGGSQAGADQGVSGGITRDNTASGPALTPNTIETGAAA